MADSVKVRRAIIESRMSLIAKYLGESVCINSYRPGRVKLYALGRVNERGHPAGEITRYMTFSEFEAFIMGFESLLCEKRRVERLG